jgi:tetratricopeptide (TPR) repeat protein
VQEVLASINHERPEKERFQFRIGVHVSDVIASSNDILGNEVNIAARLESLAEPRGVCISGAAHAFVRRALPLAYSDLDPHAVENIDEPVQAYHVAHPEQVACMGVVYTYLGRAEEGIAWLEQAKQIDPYFEPLWHWNIIGVARFVAHRHEKALMAFSRASSTPTWVQVYQAACHGFLGRLDRACEYTLEVSRRAPDFSLTCFAAKELFKRQRIRST